MIKQISGYYLAATSKDGISRGYTFLDCNMAHAFRRQHIEQGKFTECTWVDDVTVIFEDGRVVEDHDLGDNVVKLEGAKENE